MPGEYSIKITGDTSDYDKKLDQIDDKVEQVDSAIDKTEAKAKITVTNTLVALRGLTDILALYSAATGEQINTQLLSMISMSLSAAMQVQMQATIYAATPGGAPMSMIMLAMLPTITSTVMMLKSEQMKYQQQMDASNSKQINSIIDGFIYGG